MQNQVTKTYENSSRMEAVRRLRGILKGTSAEGYTHEQIRDERLGKYFENNVRIK